MADATTWAERLDPPPLEVRPVPEGRKHFRAGDLMLLPNGRAVDAAIRDIPVGEARSQGELREELARRHGADVACPFTTGISLRVVAEAAYEAYANGTPLADVAPVWRVLDAKSPALKKVSFDPGFILEQRAREAAGPSEPVG